MKYLILCIVCTSCSIPMYYHSRIIEEELVISINGPIEGPCSNYDSTYAKYRTPQSPQFISYMNCDNEMLIQSRLQIENKTGEAIELDILDFQYRDEKDTVAVDFYLVVGSKENFSKTFDT